MALWLGSWLLTIGLLTVLILRLPWTFPVLMAIVDVALVLLLVGNQTGSVAATRAGGWFVFAFVAFVIYFYVAALWEETGGRALPARTSARHLGPARQRPHPRRFGAPR